MRRLQYSLVCLLALPFFSIRHAHASLLFDPQHREHETEIRSVYAALPTRGKEVDVTVAEISPTEWKSVDDSGDPDTVGMYNDATRQLFLKQGDDEIDFTFAHEFGHHVYYASLSRTERKNWKLFWKAHRAEMPGPDAQDDPSEGFAECYAGCYYHGAAPFTLVAQVRQQMTSYFAPPRVADSRTKLSSHR